MSNKIKSMQDLLNIQSKYENELKVRTVRDSGIIDSVQTQILVCVGGGCLASGAIEICQELEAAITKHKLQKKVKVVKTGCMGPCAAGPVAKIMPEGIFYQNITKADARKIVEQHIMKGKVLTHLLHKDDSGKTIPEADRIEYFSRQNKIVLRNCGIINPNSIDEYIACNGYQAFAKVLAGMTPENVVDTMEKSGLRGRGGGGFPTGRKWRFTMQAKETPKNVVCNADEGDPGAFMDRSVLEGDPHSVIEGMSIAGYAIGASRGYVYCRAEYPLAIERLENALKQAREYGLLGENILGTKFSFDIEIRKGSGAFVCGEETALMTSIEGNRGEPRPRPPFPAFKGLWNKPTVLNNVETFANVPVIMLKGSEWYAKIGTEKSKGTKVFALAGAVNNTGLVEVPIGIPLGDLLYDIGGGMIDGKPFKAAQLGGPSGGCIPKAHLNVPLDYESLNELGAIMGSGGLIVMDDESCMVDVARFFLEFVQEESCGKCVPCRVGTKRMLEILDRICEGKGEDGDIEKLIELGNQIKDTALCGLGQTAPNPVLSTIRHFREEYVAHIRDKKCPAGVCGSLVTAPCSNACPAGVHVPGFVSLIGEKRYDEALKLHRERNPLAAICASVCFHPCESKCRRSKLDDSLSIRAVKRFMVEKEKKPQLPMVVKNADNAKKKIAIIGAGPAGLSCAYFLARMGYKPTIFEAEKKEGGMLVQTIPSYRLQRDTLDKEIKMIKSLGVEVKSGVKVGKDITLSQIRNKGYEAVFLGVGAPEGVNIGMANDNAEGVMDGVQFLREFNIKGKVSIGKNIAVIGGGNVAVDVARTALRLGAESVTVVYRRTREEMPAWEEEIEEALNEGVKFLYLSAPKEIVVGDGKVKGLKCVRMELGEFDKSGRRKPRDRKGDEFTLDVDMIVPAIGQSLNAKEVLGDVDAALTRNNYIQADPVTCRTSVEWLFAGGDAATGPDSVVGAIAAGEKAAVGIDRYLTGSEHAFWREFKAVDTKFDPDADPVTYAKAEMQLLPVNKRKGSFKEVELVLNEAAAVREARRCLRCDYREACK